MTAVPPFSIFSAISELAVTALVFWALWEAWRHDRFHGGILAVTLGFEACVNIVYMSLRLAAPSPELHVGPAMEALLAVHGTLSLLMFVGLVALALDAFRMHRHGRNALRERPRATLAFVILWSVSVASGETIFLLQLLR